MDAVFQVSRATNKVDSYQEVPNTRYKHQTARVADRNQGADANRLQDLPSSVPSLRALPTAFVSRLVRRRTGVSSCSADHMTRSYGLGLIIIGIGIIDRYPSLRFLHGHPRYLNISSIFNLRIDPPFRMCSDGYERNTTVLKNGDSRLVGSSDWPRRIRDLSRPVGALLSG
ncbi:BZ3500_MvSof-1268-A1-R1_Chr1-1g00830 [Microbotryum saponariae]|uniref:BZ3500_MvSof-1268-A1-R1_Chr1-1g00830 protein n=1 Tax=Microbotryum saponariae TaxID=289078 RepID=A0A2X0KDX3_9BASI|nr:BZ3500_MvSof-1268-A1-R1_Chr1-1g00830 [Microbotryum saponariae]SCZ92752.1 BZ3501_MvSof-1269-A2-R1_Chr1-1g00427 [Microbotryum saponariae]